MSIVSEAKMLEDKVYGYRGKENNYFGLILRTIPQTEMDICLKLATEDMREWRWGY